jgi:hypothetical protein
MEIDNPEPGVYWLYARDSSFNVLDPDTLVIENTTGIDQHHIENLKIYPNPTNTLFTLELISPIKGDLEIQNINGHLVHRSQIQSDKWSEDYNENHSHGSLTGMSPR